MRKWNAEKGMSLVEATIVLMVLAILTAIVAPSMGDYVNDARQVKAKEDVEGLGMAIMRMLRDTGKPFPQVAPGVSYLHTNRVDLLVSAGAKPTYETGMGTLAVTGDGNYLVEGNIEWDETAPAQNFALASDHLVTNVANYDDVVFPASGGPRNGLGWRGGYLEETVADPWGRRYACTTVWLGPGSDVKTTGKGTNKDTFCLSAGADGHVDTDMDGTANFGVQTNGDDLFYVFQGSSR
jgi:type II secretory pathway pseudopilin PulG